MRRTGWREATARALYGPGGFYRSPEGPAAHFRTSVHASPLFGRALAGLARAHGLRGVVDVGAGRGELLRVLAAADPGLHLLGVDVVPRPAGVPGAWSDALPERLAGVLVVANEWLDDVPCEVVEARGGRWHLVLVGEDGTEELAGPVGGADAAWLARWWPPGPDGGRAEVGRTRDEAWADLVRRLDGSVAVAVDYAHGPAERAALPRGTLAGWRGGRQVPPVPDGSCDVTAHVALDAVAAAGEAAGARTLRRVTQREALRGLGVRGDRPEPGLARTDPLAYVRALAAASEAAELTDPAGLGGFGWLEQAR
ncbi:SAM-dependent methyltransferase [Vallicoccus soli]|uniref:SAM-dependent methyltransferase n=1 Tax=Vallicoccus soli TaxID=2339232 RepID=UPI001C49C041|nr:SAM-dependent methyltransferase [Vallicoccus soli]